MKKNSYWNWSLRYLNRSKAFKLNTSKHFLFFFFFLPLSVIQPMYATGNTSEKKKSTLKQLLAEKFDVLERGVLFYTSIHLCVALRNLSTELHPWSLFMLHGSETDLLCDLLLYFTRLQKLIGLLEQVVWDDTPRQNHQCWRQNWTMSTIKPPLSALS